LPGVCLALEVRSSVGKSVSRHQRHARLTAYGHRAWQLHRASPPCSGALRAAAAALAAPPACS